MTVAGESAGGGSAMLQTMAFGGYLGDSLFSNVKAFPEIFKVRNYLIFP